MKIPRSPHRLAVAALSIVVWLPVSAQEPSSSSAAAEESSPSESAPTQAGGEETALGPDDGLVLMRSDDGGTVYWLDGRITLDAGAISGSVNDLPAGTETRRARFAIKTILHRDWAGEFDVDLADNEVDIKDFWVAYRGVERSLFKLGNQKVAVSLEELTSSRWTTFLERSLPTALVSGRRVGASYQTWRDRWQFHVGVYGEEPAAGEDEGEDEAFGYAGRISFTPVRDADRVLHFGLSTSSFGPDAGSRDRVRVRQRPELHLTERLLHTGKVDQVDRTRVVGVEAAFKARSLSVQGEYLTTRLDRFAGVPDATYAGWYAYASWIFGGERIYRPDIGEFAAVVAEDSGAFEVAARYSTLDLNDPDAGVTGGEANNVTLALNWYPNANLRLMTNYVLADHDLHADGDGDFLGDDDFSVFAMRVQYLF